LPSELLGRYPQITQIHADNSGSDSRTATYISIYLRHVRVETYLENVECKYEFIQKN
jgi:hypothetical protein